MKILCLIIISFFIVSCSGNNEEAGVIEEVGEITSEYVDTLENSVVSAKDVVNNLNNEIDKKNNLK